VKLVRFQEIAPQGNRYEVCTLAADALGDECRVEAGSVVAFCLLRPKGADAVEVRGEASATVSLQCDRCLEMFAFPVRVEFQLTLVVESGPLPDMYLSEMEADSEIDVLTEPIVDIDDLIRQQIELALPAKRICSEQCRGLCPHCGVNRAAVRCNCDEHAGDHPFAALARLKKK
jgi:uncharacterized protein